MFIHVTQAHKLAHEAMLDLQARRLSRRERWMSAKRAAQLGLSERRAMFYYLRNN